MINRLKTRFGGENPEAFADDRTRSDTEYQEDDNTLLAQFLPPNDQRQRNPVLTNRAYEIAQPIIEALKPLNKNDVRFDDAIVQEKLKVELLKSEIPRLRDVMTTLRMGQLASSEFRQYERYQRRLQSKEARLPYPDDGTRTSIMESRRASLDLLNRGDKAEMAEVRKLAEENREWGQFLDEFELRQGWQALDGAQQREVLTDAQGRCLYPSYFSLQL